MDKKIISYDLGTGGNKASLYNENGECLASTFIPYETFYPQLGWHEQRPMDWWNATVESTRQLIEKSKVDVNSIVGIGISGHSLGCIPIDHDGRLLAEYTPIWSDIRSQKEVEVFFEKVDPDHWYLTTGNGFPAACYTVFKVMWIKNNQPEIFSRIDKIIGTKDFINFMLTGKIATDYSYASGTGVYDLKAWRYNAEFIKASELPESIWPDILASTHVLGTLKPDIAKLLGLPPTVKVICGGVDNSCMALGARNTKAGRVYTSLGSSAWIAVSSNEPVLDKQYKPFVFTHVIPGMFTSAVSIFSAGTTYSWVRDNICSNLEAEAKENQQDVFVLMNREAEKAPVGSRKLLFNPSLAGGTSQDKSVHIRGAYMGLDLKHGQAELIRSAMEGIAMNLRLRLDLLRKYTDIEDEILFVGGGAKSRFYLGIFADVFNTRIHKTTIDQDAGALGAAALAAVGLGLWKDFNKIDEIHKTVELVAPIEKHNRIYEKLLPIYAEATDFEAQICERLHEVEI